VRRADAWFLGRLAAWVVVAASFVTGLLGTGLLTSIPYSSLFLMLAGWVAAPERRDEAAAAPVRHIVFRPGRRQLLPG
jgi:hypothetical protein